jgi:hypothetical protein
MANRDFNSLVEECRRRGGPRFAHERAQHLLEKFGTVYDALLAIEYWDRRPSAETMQDQVALADDIARRATGDRLAAVIRGYVPDTNPF